MIGAVLRIHRLPESTKGQGYAFKDVHAGLDCMRSVMQAGIRPLVMRLYDVTEGRVLIDGADVGLAFYVPTGGSSFTGTNVGTIGLSSGKLAYYLRAGLPVIVNRAASISADRGPGSRICFARSWRRSKRRRPISFRSTRTSCRSRCPSCASDSRSPKRA